MQRTKVFVPSIENEIRIPDLRAVQAYLKGHADLAACLPAVFMAMRKEFGPDAELCLEVYRDPEIRDQYLTLYVRLDNYDNETMARIDRASAKLDGKLARASGYLLLTTDFRAPRGDNGV